MHPQKWVFDDARSMGFGMLWKKQCKKWRLLGLGNIS